jgi:hypothetical protein
LIYELVLDPYKFVGGGRGGGSIMIIDKYTIYIYQYFVEFCVLILVIVIDYLV